MLQKKIIVSLTVPKDPTAAGLVTVIPSPTPETPFSACTIVITIPTPRGIRATGACSLRSDSCGCCFCSGRCLRLQEWSCSCFGCWWFGYQKWCGWGISVRGICASRAWGGCDICCGCGCISFGFALSLNGGRDRGVGLMTSRTSSLCSGALLLFAFKIAPNQGKVFLIHLFEEITSAIKRDLDSTLPGQQATECATTADLPLYIGCPGCPWPPWSLWPPSGRKRYMGYCLNQLLKMFQGYQPYFSFVKSFCFTE